MARWTERMGALAAQFAARPSVRAHSKRPLQVLAILLPIMLFGAFAWYDYTVRQQQAVDDLNATADSLAEHASSVLETANLVLAHVLDHTRGQDWDTISGSPETHTFLQNLRQELPQLESIFLVGPLGINVATSRQFPAEPISNADRGYYSQANQGEAEAHANSKFRGRIADTYAFTLIRPRLRADTFDGIAGVTLSPQYFQTFYNTVLKHPRSTAAALVRDDGALLAWFPDNGFAARLASGAPLLNAIRDGQVEGHLVDAFGYGRRWELTAFRRLDKWPLVATYTIDTALYLHGWYLHMIFFAASACLVGLALMWAEKVMLETSRQERQVLVRLVDETKRRQQAEAALLQSQKLEALGRLTGGVAHDFNNLLAAIMGSLEMLQKHITQPRQVRLITMARKAAERGAQLTGQMLAFSRHKEMAMRPVDAAATIRGLDQLLRQTVGTSISIVYRIAGEPCLAMADQTQLEVALLNLVVNARDAMPGCGTLTLGCRRITLAADCALAPGLPAGTYIEVFVKDTGEGMTEEVRLRAFEPFFTTKGPSKGTGLGLSMVFGFATMSGGSAVVDSTPGAGTTVRFFLPEATAPNLPAAQSPEAIQEPVATQDTPRGRRILLVDDDPEVRSTIQAMLEELGYEAVVAEDAAAALDILATDRRFDLLMIDFAMPDINGSQLADMVCADWPGAPLMFISGYVENDSLTPWRAQGIAMLSKPFTQADLSSAVRQAIERQGAPRRLPGAPPAQSNAANNSSSAFN